MSSILHPLLSSSTSVNWLTGWNFHGSFTAVDLIAASTNALNGALRVSYTLRMTALYRGWEEPLAAEPAGVYKHDNGRPLLGRKIAGKSERELRDLGLAIDAVDPAITPSTATLTG